MLSRELVDAPYVETLKFRLDKPVSNQIYQGPFQFRWFYDSLMTTAKNHHHHQEEQRDREHLEID